jgi:hypothetical protein
MSFFLGGQKFGKERDKGKGFREKIWNLNFLFKSDQQVIDMGWLIMETMM